MYRTIAEVLNDRAMQYSQKIVFGEKEATINYSDFNLSCKKIGSFLLHRKFFKSNIAIFIDKSINCLSAMFGCAYAGCCYTIIDVSSPEERINTILNTFSPECIITDAKNYANLQHKCSSGSIKAYCIEDMTTNEVQEELLLFAKERIIDTDPLYVLFTSGSTGVPKGTVVCHRSVIDYADSICKTFDIDETTIWGSQTPFYFSMSILDVFGTIYSGATLYIIPKMMFSFPVMLIKFMNDKMINSIYWVPTALGIVANLDTFAKEKPQYLKRVLFAGEVMPIKQLNYWIDNMPDAMYANLYGPTEITDTCTYFVVDRKFEVGESLPIGKAFPNCEVLIIDQNGNEIKHPDESEGELHVRGSFLGLGYYNNSEKTSQAFVENPLNKCYPELLYKTGDIVRYSNDGNLIYIGRKDNQIKIYGHRIELGEVEAAAMKTENVDNACCLFDSIKEEIVLIYEGKQEAECVIEEMKAFIPQYMIPKSAYNVKAFPINANGKVDRKALKEQFIG